MTARILLQRKESLEISNNPQGRGLQSVFFGAFYSVESVKCW